MIELRDQLAMAAMQGELSGQHSDLDWENEEALASRAYKIADAMLAERNKGKTERRLELIKNIAENMLNKESISMENSAKLILMHIKELEGQ